MTDTATPATVRPARAADIDAIMQIEEASFKGGVIEERATFVKRQEAFAEGVLVAEAPDGAVCGYATAEIWEKAPLTPALFALDHDPIEAHKPDGTMLYLSSMGVLPEYRGVGAGRALFTYVYETLPTLFQTIDTGVLIVGADWAKAISIYEKNGFQTVETIPGFFEAKDSPPMDGIVMTKRLKGN